MMPDHQVLRPCFPAVTRRRVAHLATWAVGARQPTKPLRQEPLPVRGPDLATVREAPLCAPGHCGARFSRHYPP